MAGGDRQPRRWPTILRLRGFSGMASKSAVSRRFVRRTAGELEALLGRDHPHRAVALTDLHCVACTRGP